MPVLPKAPLGHRIGSAAAKIVLEAPLDFCCPFSRKIFLRIVREVLPAFEAKAPGQVAFLHYNCV